MEVLTIPKTSSQMPRFWILLVLTELFIAYTTILFPYYVIPSFLVILLLLAILPCPELAYFLFILSISCHLIQYQINFAHSVPPKMWRIDIVPVDIVALRSLITNFLVIVATLSWFTARMAKTKPSYPKTELDLPVVAFFIWFTISLIWTPDWSTGVIVMFALFCCYLGFFLSVTVIRTKKILNTTIWLLIFVGLVNSVVVAYSLHGDPVWKELYRSENISLYFNFIHMARKRGMGFIYSPMSAYFLNIPIVLSIAMLLVTKSLKKKVVIALIIFFMVYAHLATVSKGGLVGLLAALSFIVLTHKIFRKYFFISLFIIAATFIIASVFVYLSWPWPEAAELFRGRKSLFPRMIIWGTGLEEFVQTYGFGFGGGSFFPAHSIYLQVLFELGIPGLFIWLWLVLKLFNILKTSLKKFTDPYYRIMTICFSAGMISILTVGLADSYYFEEIMWAFLGIGMAIINLAKKNSPEMLQATKVS